MTSTQYSHDPTAVVGRRFGAYVVDVLLVLMILPAIVFFASAGITEYTSGPPCSALELAGEVDSSHFCIREVSTPNTQEDAGSSTFVFNRSAVYLAAAVYVVYLVVVMWIVQGLTGTTLGKALFGIRTVNQEGASIGVGRQLVRGVLWIIDGIGVCGFPLVAILTISLTKGHRRLGDMAAGSYVVGKPDAGAPIVVPNSEGALAPAPQAYSPPASSAPGAYSPPSSAQSTSTASGAEAPEATERGGAGSPPPPTSAQADGPQWDAARNAYIYWDASRSAWLIHDAASGEWKPLT